MGKSLTVGCRAKEKKKRLEEGLAEVPSILSQRKNVRREQRGGKRGHEKKTSQKSLKAAEKEKTLHPDVNK